LERITRDKWGWLKETVPIFILLILVSVFFSEVLFGNKIFIHRDLSRFFYPLREFSVSQFRAGQIPLWNPYIHCGSPHLAELQTCVFYPLSIIYLLFSFQQAFNYFIILHIFLAGVFTYILMREWNHSRHAAFFSASVFMFSGYIISVINLLASLASVVWLPLVILFYERAIKGEWVRNSLITGVFMALMLLGGEPAILYTTVFILLILGSGQRFRPLLLALVVAAGLTAFQILPFLEFLKHTSRSAMDFTEASMWSLPPYALLDLFIPYLSESDYLYKGYWARQSWLLVYYMGVFTIICAIMSLKFEATKRRKAFFYILALGLVLSFGRYTPIYYFLYKVMPGFELSRYPIKFFFMVAFALAILAGMGLDYFRKGIGTDLKLRGFIKALLVLAFIGSFFYLLFNLNFAQIYNFLYKKILSLVPEFMDKKENLAQMVYVTVYNSKRAIGILMALSIAMFLGFKKKIRLSLLMPILLSIFLLDVFTANRHVYQNMDMGEFLETGSSVEFLQSDRALYRIFNSPTTLRQNTFVPERDYFEGMQALKERMASNKGVSFGISDAYGYGSLYNRRHEELIETIVKKDLPDETNLLDLLNVKYVLSPKEFEAEGYRVVKRGDKANIYANEDFLPRAFLVDKAVVIKDEKEILERLASKDFEPVEEVILETPSPFPSPQSGDGRVRDRVNILSYSPNEVIIEANVSEPRFLILSDTYYPGWKAYVDGAQTRIYRANYIMRAVHLGAGKHTIKFTYDPFSFKIGAIVTLLTLIALGGVVFYSGRLGSETH